MSSTTTATPAGPSSSTPSRRRPVLVGALALVLIATAVVVWLTRGGDDKAPYTDARSTGTLTLCSDGKPVTSGSINRKPFVDLAVGATAPVGVAAQDGRVGTLYAHQPREGTESSEWSGQLLTAASTYTNLKHPMAAATKRDIPLKDFLQAFPTRWDGFLQIRLVLGSLSGTDADSYDAVNIKVDGSSWKVVGTPGTASCTDGKATSSETAPTS